MTQRQLLNHILTLNRFSNVHLTLSFDEYFSDTKDMAMNGYIVYFYYNRHKPIKTNVNLKKSIKIGILQAGV